MACSNRGRVLGSLLRAATATGAALLLSLGLAKAADLPSPAAPPLIPSLPASPYNWTGFYAGVNAGFGLDHFAFPYTISGPTSFVTGMSGITSRGPVAGAQAGFNYQFFNVPIIGNAVVGLEASVDWADLHGSVAVPTALGTFSPSTRFQDFGTLRARVGWAFDRLLLYLAGGLTFGTVNAAYTVGPPSNFAGSTTFTRTGFIPHVDTVGLGAEYAISNNWTVRVEYMYDCIIAKNEIFAPVPGSASNVQFATRAMYHIVTVGLNYKFDWFAPPTPVVAKY